MATFTPRWSQSRCFLSPIISTDDESFFQLFCQSILGDNLSQRHLEIGRLVNDVIALSHEFIDGTLRESGGMKNKLCGNGERSEMSGDWKSSGRGSRMKLYIIHYPCDGAERLQIDLFSTQKFLGASPYLCFINSLTGTESIDFTTCKIERTRTGWLVKTFESRDFSLLI